MNYEEKIPMTKKYMCGVTFEYELGETDDIGLYESLEELKSKTKCWSECGIVEIELENETIAPEKYTSHKWIELPTLFRRD